jgi:hypothetical protein
LRCSIPARYLAEAGWTSELLDRRDPYRYDVVVFQKLYDEPALGLAGELRARGIRVVLDLCDNHLYNPEGVPKLARRSERLLRMLELADVVSVSTATLGELLPRRDAIVVDDVLDEYDLTKTRQRVRSRLPRLGVLSKRSPELTLVWFGGAGMTSPSFGLTHLRKIVPVLNELNRELPLELTVISNSRSGYRAAASEATFASRYVEWRLDGFPAQFHGHSICVIPIVVNPFTRCKTANRVALSLHLGTPVIADRIPSFDEFEPYVLFGDWATSIRRYAEDSELRERHVREGGRFVRVSYTRERAIRQWSSLFERALAS